MKLARFIRMMIFVCMWHDSHVIYKNWLWWSSDDRKILLTLVLIAFNLKKVTRINVHLKFNVNLFLKIWEALNIVSLLNLCTLPLGTKNTATLSITFGTIGAISNLRISCGKTPKQYQRTYSVSQKTALFILYSESQNHYVPQGLVKWNALSTNK